MSTVLQAMYTKICHKFHKLASQNAAAWIDGHVIANRIQWDCNKNIVVFSQYWVKFESPTCFQHLQPSEILLVLLVDSYSSTISIINQKDHDAQWSDTKYLICLHKENIILNFKQPQKTNRWCVVQASSNTWFLNMVFIVFDQSVGGDLHLIIK